MPTQTKPGSNYFTPGVNYMLMSALGFALMAACVKWSYQSGIPLLEIVAARALISLILSYVDIKRKKLSLLGNNKPLLLARGIVGSLALVCVYYAVTALPLAEATVIQYLHPMFTAILATLFLKEHLRLPTVLCIFLSFMGLLLIAQPAFIFQGNEPPLPGFAIFVAILGAFGSAVAYVIVRKLSQTEDASVIIFYFPMIACPLAVLLPGESFVLPHGTQWIVLALVGVFTQVGQIGLTKSMRTETAARATALSYTQVLFALFIGWTFFDEFPPFWTWVGGTLILLGALTNVFVKSRG